MIDVNPNPTLIKFGTINVYFYGIIIVFGILLSMYLIEKFSKDRGVEKKHLENLYFYLIIFGIIGARIYSILFFDFDYYKYNIVEIFKIWHGGIAIQGAIISGVITVYFYCKKNKLNILKYLDVFALVMPLGQAIGRWGNFFNEELYGKISSVPWAIYIQKTGFHHHPIFIYEFILNLILFFVLLKIFKVSKGSSGVVFFSYIMGYGIIRFSMEFLRIDLALKIFGIRFPQIIALIFILFSGYFLFIDKKYKKLYN